MTEITNEAINNRWSWTWTTTLSSKWNNITFSPKIKSNTNVLSTNVSVFLQTTPNYSLFTLPLMLYTAQTLKRAYILHTKKPSELQ